MQTLNLSYSKWKQVRSSLSLQAYYVQAAGTSLDIVLVDLSNSFVYASHVSKNTELTDFVTTIQPNASLQVSFDDCIASAVVH